MIWDTKDEGWLRCFREQRQSLECGDRDRGEIHQLTEVHAGLFDAGDADGRKPAKENTMTFNEKVNEIIRDANEEVEMAAAVVLPHVSARVREALEVETDREYENARKAKPTPGMIAEAASVVTGCRESDSDFERRRQEHQTLKEQTAVKAAEIAGSIVE